MLALLLGTSAWLYARGVRRLWRAAGTGRGVRGRDVACFAAGWIVLAAALLSPIDAVADRSFALHMVQHELLMVIAAPLLVLGRPVEAWTWALAPASRRRLGRLAHVRPWRLAWAAVTGTAAAWWLHALAIWIWHVPPLFVAALADLALHVLQHACFLGSALLFWRSVVRAGATRRGGGALFSVFTTMLYTGALGALLTFAREPWYVSAAQATLLGLTPLEDQQLGGLLMWVPGGVAYLVAGLWIVAAWLAPPWREAAPMASATVETRVRFNDSPELHA